MLTGREREAKLIKQANRAAAVGRLLLGETKNWHEFLEADIVDLENLPRKRLKAGVADIKSRLSVEIKRFCSRNFREMDESKLSLLYEEIKAHRGFEIPLQEFEQKYAQIKREVLKGNPAHLTVCISLWGLQYKFPEDELAKDLIQALQLAAKAQDELEQYKERPHSEIETERIKISSVIRQKIFAARSALLSCFNLIEAYLNGLAWDYIQRNGTENLSNKQRKLLEDTASASIRDKLMKYPNILTGKEVWRQPDGELETFINALKPFRDSLVHPSPFSAPEKFGGYDKLRLLYRIDHDTALLTANLLVVLVRRIHEHVYSNSERLPEWIENLRVEIDKFGEFKQISS
jgi:hypothetical protein